MRTYKTKYNSLYFFQEIENSITFCFTKIEMNEWMWSLHIRFPFRFKFSLRFIRFWFTNFSFCLNFGIRMKEDFTQLHWYLSKSLQNWEIFWMRNLKLNGFLCVLNFNPLPLLRVSSFPRKRPKHRIKAESYGSTGCGVFKRGIQN